MRGRINALAVMAALAGGVGGPALVFPFQNNHEAPTRRKQPSKTVQYSTAYSYPRRGPGWTAAHVKRMALKRRNQLRMKGQR